MFAPATNDTDELSASHASIRALLVKAGKRHRDVKASLDAKLAAADAKERGRAEETQSFVAKLNARWQRFARSSRCFPTPRARVPCARCTQTWKTR